MNPTTYTLFLERLGIHQDMLDRSVEWLDQLGKGLAGYWPIALALGLVLVAGIIRMLAKRHKPNVLGPKPESLLPLPVLLGINGVFAGSAIALTDAPVLMGRDPKVCQLVFPANVQGISKKHCILRYHAKSQCFLLVDCNSGNGTFVLHGERLPNGGSQLLNAGQRFYLTDPENMFEVGFKAPR